MLIAASIPASMASAGVTTMNGHTRSAVGLFGSPWRETSTPSASAFVVPPGSLSSVIVIFGFDPLLTMTVGPASVLLPPWMVNERYWVLGSVKSCGERIQSVVGAVENAEASKVMLPPTGRTYTSCDGDTLK